MGKAPPDATQLRTLRRECKDISARLYRAQSTIEIQARAIKDLTSERDEWKRRFDLLLSKSAGENL